MTAVPRSIVCDRVRSQVSLRLDGELSQLESRMVDAHLARCAACREFEAEISEFTETLRVAPLEPIARPVVVTQARRRLVSRAQVGMVAAVAVAVLGALSQLGDRQPSPQLRKPDRFETSQQLTREVNQIIADGKAFAQRAGSVTPI